MNTLDLWDKVLLASEMNSHACMKTAGSQGRHLPLLPSITVFGLLPYLTVIGRVILRMNL